MWVFRKVYRLEEYITKRHFVNVGVLLTIIAAFYGYFTFSDYLTKWYGSIKMDSILIDKLFSEYYALFIFANYIGILIPGIIIALPRFRTIPNITIAAVIAVLALWVNRYIIVIPTLETPFLPIQDVRDCMDQVFSYLDRMVPDSCGCINFYNVVHADFKNCTYYFYL